MTRSHMRISSRPMDIPMYDFSGSFRDVLMVELEFQSQAGEHSSSKIC